LFDKQISPDMRLPIGRILLFGILALYVLLAVLLRPQWFALGACITFLAAIGVGFTFIPRRVFSATWLPGIDHNEDALELFGTVVAQRYPQMVIFRTHLKNLWLLIPCVAGALGTLLWLVKNPTRMPTGIEVLLFRVFFAPVVLVGYKWVRERWIMRFQAPVLGLTIHANDEEVFYEFYFAPDERHGDIALQLPWSAGGGPLVLVFVNPNRPEHNEPSFNLLFHRVEIAERIHWPEARFDQA
jgi:hypothetical protein